MLDSSKNLRLLNFLCDEALCTADLRTWIDEKNSKIIKKEKEARQRVTIAKDKEKQAKQQLQDEIEKANANASPLSLLERDELVVKMKKETEIAQSEMQHALKKIPWMKQRSDAVRTDSVLFDGKGHVFWLLKYYSGQPDILVQGALLRHYSYYKQKKSFVCPYSLKNRVSKGGVQKKRWSSIHTERAIEF